MANGFRLTDRPNAAGCAAKLGPAELAQVLTPPPIERASRPAGRIPGPGDDATVWRPSDGRALVQTVDYFTPVVDDPYHFGAIAVANAVSDVYAMGAEPLFRPQHRRLAKGRSCRCRALSTTSCAEARHNAGEAGVRSWGVTPCDDSEPKYGLVVTGSSHPTAPLRNATARLGDILVLTKPLGTGDNDHRQQTRHRQGGPGIAAALASCAAQRAVARDARPRSACTACTDVTGYGLLGHRHEMTGGSGVSARLDLHELPVIHGVRSLVVEGFVPGGTLRNLEFVGDTLRPVAVRTSRCPRSPTRRRPAVCSSPARTRRRIACDRRDARGRRERDERRRAGHGASGSPSMTWAPGSPRSLMYSS